MTDSFDLRTLRALPQVLDRTPDGRETMELASRLGLFNKQTHNRLESDNNHPAFTRQFPELPAKLSELYAYWTGEAGRVIEVCGLLQAQEKRLTLQAKSARTSARGRLRKENAERLEGAEADLADKDMSEAARKRALAPFVMSASQLNDEAEDQPEVRDADEALMFIQVLLATAQARKEAVLLYLTSISREISYRGDQLRRGVM